MSSVSHPATRLAETVRSAARALRASLTLVCTHWRIFVPNQRFVVEFDRQPVGVAVRVPGGFMFFSSNDQYDEIDGRIFRRARALERELRKFARTKRRSAPQHRLSAI